MEKIIADDIRYADLAGKRFNKRFTGKPEYIYLPQSADDVVDAVQEAVNSKRRLVARSGGYCLEGEKTSLAWLRNFYHDLFESSGGVPIPNEQTAGSMINHPDTDLADPQWNKSAVPWHTLYYNNNYSRLQQVKRRWDPLNIFYHALSIRPGM